MGYVSGMTNTFHAWTGDPVIDTYRIHALARDLAVVAGERWRDALPTWATVHQHPLGREWDTVHVGHTVLYRTAGKWWVGGYHNLPCTCTAGCARHLLLGEPVDEHVAAEAPR